jgi:hypothetical protein
MDKHQGGQTMEFQVKRSPILVALVICITLLPFAMIATEPDKLAEHIIPLALAFFLSHALLKSYLLVEEDRFIIVFGIIRRTIPIREITEIEYTWNPLSAPAWTLRRMRVVYGHRSMLVSLPKDEQALFSKLREINANIRFPDLR